MSSNRIAKRRGDTLVGLLLAVAVAAVLIQITQNMNVAGCDDLCNYDLLETTNRVFLALIPSVSAATIALYLALRSRAQRAWLIPATGSLLLVVVLVITIAIINTAIVI